MASKITYHQRITEEQKAEIALERRAAEMAIRDSAARWDGSPVPSPLWDGCTIAADVDEKELIIRPGDTGMPPRMIGAVYAAIFSVFSNRWFVTIRHTTGRSLVIRLGPKVGVD